MNTSPLQGALKQRYGLLFEQLSVPKLSILHPSLQIQHSGQTNDQGIDFKGFHLSNSTNNLPIIGQCKFTSKGLSIAHLREFFSTISIHNSTFPTLGILVSNSPSPNLTKSCLSLFQRSSFLSPCIYYNFGVDTSVLDNFHDI